MNKSPQFLNGPAKPARFLTPPKISKFCTECRSPNLVGFSAPPIPLASPSANSVKTFYKRKWRVLARWCTSPREAGSALLKPRATTSCMFIIRVTEFISSPMFVWFRFVSRGFARRLAAKRSPYSHMTETSPSTFNYPSCRSQTQAD